jgi:hypothetical protein
MMRDGPKPRDIAPLRQPMVTSLGIIMGFILNFLASWATEDEGRSSVFTNADRAVAVTLLLAIVLMCIVLFRLLDIRQPEHVQEERYVRTFQLYVAAIVIAVSGVGLALFL